MMPTRLIGSEIALLGNRRSAFGVMVGNDPSPGKYVILRGRLQSAAAGGVPGIAERLVGIGSPGGGHIAKASKACRPCLSGVRGLSNKMTFEGHAACRGWMTPPDADAMLVRAGVDPLGPHEVEVMRLTMAMKRAAGRAPANRPSRVGLAVWQGGQDLAVVFVGRYNMQLLTTLDKPPLPLWP